MNIKKEMSTIIEVKDELNKLMNEWKYDYFYKQMTSNLIYFQRTVLPLQPEVVIKRHISNYQSECLMKE